MRLAASRATCTKGLIGLAALVQTELAEDPFSGQLFVFRGRVVAHRRDCERLNKVVVPCCELSAARKRSLEQRVRAVLNARGADGTKRERDHLRPVRSEGFLKWVLHPANAMLRTPSTRNPWRGQPHSATNRVSMRAAVQRTRCPRSLSHLVRISRSAIWPNLGNRAARAIRLQSASDRPSACGVCWS